MVNERFNGQGDIIPLRRAVLHRNPKSPIPRPPVSLPVLLLRRGFFLKSATKKNVPFSPWPLEVWE